MFMKSIYNKIKYNLSRGGYIHRNQESRILLLLRMIRVALTPSTMTLTSTLRNGVKIRGKNMAGWGGRGIYIYRDDIAPELKLLPKLLPKNGVLIDIGANVGVYSLSAAKIVGIQGKVIAIEPFPKIFSRLCDNVSLNGFETIIRTRNFCIDDKTGPNILWMNFNRPVAFSLIKIGDASGIPVLSIRLDDLLKWENLDHVDYIKIDAEGAESNILIGAETTLRKFRPIIQVEGFNNSITKQLKQYKALQVSKTRNTIFIPEEKYNILSDIFDDQWSLIN